MKLITRLTVCLLFCLPFLVNAQAPTITSFSPASGAVGTLVTITGSNFSTLTGFTIGGKSAILVSVTPTQLVGMVMTGAITGSVFIANSSGSATGSNNFTVTPTGYPSVQQGSKLVGSENNGAAGQGTAIALSADGNTAIVGGYLDNLQQGAAWVFTRTNNVWAQQGNKLTGTDFIGTPLNQGISVALSADGNTALVGGFGDNNSKGAVWVYTRTNNVWTQQGNKLVGTGGNGSSTQGRSVAASADGNTVIIGGFSDSSNKGAAWVFTRTGSTWTQQGNKLIGNGGASDARQGTSVALSADGNTALVGGFGDNNNQGATWVFTRTGSTWTQQGNKLVGTSGTSDARQGWSVSLSADGNTALTGGYNDNNAVGAAWIFNRNGLTWTQKGSKLVGTNNIGSSQQGYSTAISADGKTVIVGGKADNGNTGALWVYKYDSTGDIWVQQGNKLLGNLSGQAQFGFSSAVSADGHTTACGGFNDNNQQGAAWMFISASTLPLQLLSFAAQQQNNTVTLNWQTANEVNSSHFNIERSTDGVSFTAVGKVVAKGNGGYVFDDDLATVSAQPSTVYYRLQVVDKDGSFTYSKTVSIELTTHNSPLTIFPNPVKEILTASVTVSKAEKATLQVTDMNGKVLLQKNVTLNAGINVLPVNTVALAKGNYVLLVKGASVQQKIFVKE